MAEKINWTLNVEVSEGPKVFQAETIEAEAFGKVAVTVLAGDNTDVEVQPSSGGQVDLLLICASAYGDALTYQPYQAGGTLDATASPWKLNGPHLLVGTGAVEFLAEDPKKIHVINGLTEDVTVEILVARDATP